MTTQLDEWYAQNRDDPASDISYHFPAFFDAVAETDAQAVIELGVRAGASTSAWLSALAPTHGHLWSVDVDATLLPARHGWTFLRGDDLDPELLRLLPEAVDIVFIDTSHAYDHTLWELQAYVPRVRSGGLVLLHDTANEDPAAHGEPIGEQPPFPVRKAIDDYCSAAGLDWSEDTVSWGLGTIRVR